jgi:hypothetical protein
MDQDDSPSQHDDSNYNLYDTYDPTMEEDIAAGPSDVVGFHLGGWDHHGQSVEEAGYSDVTTHRTGYDSSTTNMDDFGTTHYRREFQHGESFEHDGHQFQDFMAQESMTDQHARNEGYDMNSMDLYNTSPIYSNLTRENPTYGTQISDM